MAFSAIEHSSPSAYGAIIRKTWLQFADVSPKRDQSSGSVQALATPSFTKRYRRYLFVEEGVFVVPSYQDTYSYTLMTAGIESRIISPFCSV